MEQKLQFQTLPKDPKLSESFDVYLCNSYSLPSFAIKFLKEQACHYKARKDDLYVISYPKTGTTWTQEIVYSLHSDLNFDVAKSVELNERFPYIEHARTDIDNVVNMESPRLLKSHLPYSLLPRDILQKKCKIIYVTRNPKDVAVSYFHFACSLRETQYQGGFDQFFERFILNRTTYSPFLNHNLEFWNKRHESNILFLFYEDMQTDLGGNVKQIADFMGKAVTEQQLDSVVEHCTFKSMSETENATKPDDTFVHKQTKFFRKGKVGDWKNYFNKEQNERMDQWVQETLKDSSLEYTYEL